MENIAAFIIVIGYGTIVINLMLLFAVIKLYTEFFKERVKGERG